MRMIMTILLVVAAGIGAACADDARPEATARAESATASIERAADVASDATLDGARFAIEGNVKGKSEIDPQGNDTITFDGGNFHSHGCDMYGFGTAPAALTPNGDEISFSSTTTSATEGKMTWSGTVRGNTIEGMYRWEKEGQDPIEYWFRGVRM